MALLSAWVMHILGGKLTWENSTGPYFCILFYFTSFKIKPAQFAGLLQNKLSLPQVLEI